MRVALYVSSNARGQAQIKLEQLRQYCNTQGWTTTAEYIDHEPGRNAFARLLSAANEHEFDVVVTAKLAMLPHRPAITAFNHVAQWYRAGVGFKSLDEPLFQTYDEPGGQAFAAIAAALDGAEW
jgi:DNA invertase Pin-like site-specific DNA recombinase